MAKGVSLGIFSDTQAFERGIRTGVIDPLDDARSAVDSLADARPAKVGDDLANDVQHGVSSAQGDLGRLATDLKDIPAPAQVGDDLARDVSAGVDGARTDLDRLEDKMREYRKTAHTQTGQAGKDISHSVKQGAHDASEGVGEMKESVKGGAKEIAGSFDGTMEGVAGGVQGVLSEVGAGFGPLGVIVSTGLGLALGGVMAQLDGTQQLSDDAKERISALAQEFLDAGGKGERTFGQVGEAIKALATETDPAKLNLSELWTEAHDAGVDYSDLVAAIASGNAGDIEKVRKKVEKLGDQHYKAGENARIAGQRTSDAASKGYDATLKLGDQLDKTKEEAKRAAEAQRLAAKAGLTDFSLKNDLVDQLHDGFSDAADEVDTYIDKESGLFDTTRYIKAMHRRAAALEEYQTTLSKSKLTPEARSFIESQGAEQAAVLMAGYKHATPSQRRELEGIWTTSGRKAARSYGEALGDDLRDKTVKGPKISRPYIPAPDMTALHRALNTVDNRTVTIKLRGVAEGRRIF
jgi:hypothetical protein